MLISKVFKKSTQLILKNNQYRRFILQNKRLVVGIMSASTGSNHLDRTADNTRHNVVSMATIIGMRNESQTVKGLTVKIHDKNVTFKAGQWVDMFIPGVDTVGGFSMCSSPGKLIREGILDLAVKYSDHPPALWVHTKCEVGAQVNVRVGGDVYYNPADCGPQEDLLFIAGGVGVNPLYSMLCHVTDLLSNDKGDNSSQPSSSSTPKNVVFLYSASKEDELLFKKNISQIAETYSNIKCKYFVTQGDNCTETDVLKCRRITENDIQESLKVLNKDNLLSYLCGPFTMLSDMENLLIKNGVKKTQICYEKWT